MAEVNCLDANSLLLMISFSANSKTELIIFLNLSDHVKYALQMPSKSEMELDKEKIKTIISNL